MAMIDLKGGAKNVHVEDSKTTSDSVLKADFAEGVRIVRTEAGMPSSSEKAGAPKPGLLVKLKDIVLEHSIASIFAIAVTAALAWLGLSD